MDKPKILIVGSFPSSKKKVFGGASASSGGGSYTRYSDGVSGSGNGNSVRSCGGSVSCNG